MNTRTLTLLGMMGLVALGVIMIVQALTQKLPAERTIVPAIAAAQIPPYTYITQDMVKVGRELRLKDGQAKGVYPVDAVVGLMSTDLVAPGEMLTGVNAKPVAEVRAGVKDLGLELVSFAASGERGFGGRLRPGHIINLYGNGSDKTTRRDFTEMVAPRLWVVDVSSSGEPAVVETPQPDVESGAYGVRPGARNRPVNIVTVAVPPQTALHIIEALGTRNLQPWVTLAANQSPAFPMAQALTTPTPQLSSGPAYRGTVEALQTLMASTPVAPIGTLGAGGSQSVK